MPPRTLIALIWRVFPSSTFASSPRRTFPIVPCQLSFCRSKITPKTNFSQSSYNSVFMTDIRWWAPADIYWHSWPLNSQLFPSRDSRGGHALYEPGQILFNAEGGSFTKPIKISKTFWQIRRKHWKTVHLTTVQDTSWWQSVHAFSFLTTGGTFLTQATWEWL